MQNNKTIIGIDASNIREGGGVTHICELLKNISPDTGNFDKVIIWGPKKTLDVIVDRKWISKNTYPVLERNYIVRAWWQWRILGKLALSENCSILFVPGGVFFSNFRPIVNMSQNMLPFDLVEARRYGVSLFTLKLLLLRLAQSISFKKANGIIFLTQYSCNSILSITGYDEKNCAIIPHGIDGRFFYKPKEQRSISKYSYSNPLKLVYVSTIEPYKHQCNVVKAVCKLRQNKVPVTLDLYGSSIIAMRSKLNHTIRRCDPLSEYIKYYGPAEHSTINKLYTNYDMSIFASSCENLPIILLESMAAGLPVACSNIDPMPSILKDGGVYFNPLDVNSIYYSVLMLIKDSDLRCRISEKSYDISHTYSWNKCARDTFKFLNKNAHL